MEVYDPKLKRMMSYPLTTINLLPYFGAANDESQGYIFVPDGPGALIYLNNGKTTAETYGRAVYGRDRASMPVNEYSADSKEQIYLPVFGLKNDDRAFVAILEDGDAMGQINAVVAGMRDSYTGFGLRLSSFRTLVLTWKQILGMATWRVSERSRLLCTSLVPIWVT